MKILIIEDELQLAKSIRQYLQRENYLCEVEMDITEGRSMIEDFAYDCILLDINLPGGSGLTLLKELKQDKKTDGVIIISARDALEDKVLSLKLGADDYLAKPFHLAELSARIETVIRRRYLQGDSQLSYDSLVIDTLARSVSVDGETIQLTKTEYELLLFLMINKGRVITKNAIAEHLLGGSALYLDNFDIIYAHVKNLKKKLQSMGGSIKTIYGTGYKFS
ncbi:response regulator transcription factor [Arachidicoccus ginsenosidivorans]|uniref:Response regulator transcription factor n=1 Tax=Arachidicoccus ginsenosidivorans TaxID=496057 RepID=A0A5B8VQC1_9BACT|nr:response regulator transcription factor [Arachidicoccus ginsenosidivorans]QEC72468.1 response regulator transcription factor [Arachidicoccus ginsenosidivorans]